MKKKVSLVIRIVVITCVFTGFTSLRVYSGESVRPAVWAGRFYPGSSEALKETIARLTAMAEKDRADIPDMDLKGLVMPHAGYEYSGPVAAHASLVLKGGKFNKVIVMGPDHRVGFYNAAVSDCDFYQTPLGMIRVGTGAEKLRKWPGLFRAVPQSDKSEHSIEVILPFLQYYLGKFALVPIVMGSGSDLTVMLDKIQALVDNKTLVVASSDLSHYLPYNQAVARDRDTINLILRMDWEGLLKKRNAACGAVPVAMLIRLARRRGWKPVKICYANSGDSSGDRSRVVGYTVIAFYGEKPMTKKKKKDEQKLTRGQGQCLVKLARKTIMSRFGLTMAGGDELDTALQEKVFKEKRATFVTLTIEGHLRGCIGTLKAFESLPEDVERNAVNAAFHDFRFPPVNSNELAEIAVEVSVLTKPEPLEYTDAQDLISKLKPDVDGLIIRKGGARATFLPQVWKQLPLPEDFLGNLCMKAGMPEDIWQHTKLEVQTYQVQYFDEKK